MGVHDVKATSKQDMNEFVNSLLTDIKALEKMLDAGMFEENVNRIGAEQEIVLVDNSWRPYPVSMELLKKLDDNHYTTEIALYNIEVNFDPQNFTGNCLSRMEQEIGKYVNKVDDAMKELEGTSILVGILPTIRKADIDLKYLTPLPRYELLNDVLNRMRGGPFEFRIQGADELITKNDSVMFEGCNTSFQLHMQVNPDTFVQSYNWASVIAGPTLAAAVNSPMLLGRRLWKETRIALFHQSIDTRSLSNDIRLMSSRVDFGKRWFDESVTEIYKDGLSKHRVILTSGKQENSLDILEKGKIPALKALCAYNGTIYNWNRACYGVYRGKPTLRIENRVLPAGPTIVDQVANAAFWFGLMKGHPKEYYVIPPLMQFDEAKVNFLRGARMGLDAQFRWLDRKMYPAKDLILNELLPIAKEGLEKAKIDKGDISKYLGIIEGRVKSMQTGARWTLDSFYKLKKKAALYETAAAITAGIAKRQKRNQPIHFWSYPEISEAGPWENRFQRAVQIMTTDLFTVYEDDPVSLAINIMIWNHVKYLPVEDQNKNLVGLVTARRIINYFFCESGKRGSYVRDIMLPDPKTVEPDILTIDALNLMKEMNIGSLPVVEDNKLVGLITAQNYFGFSIDIIKALINK